MPIEIIVEFGTPGAETERLQAQGTLAVQHLQKICGSPPPEMELEIVWQEYELGAYPTFGLTWEDGMRGAPWSYISINRARQYGPQFINNRVTHYGHRNSAPGGANAIALRTKVRFCEHILFRTSGKLFL